MTLSVEAQLQLEVHQLQIQIGKKRPEHVVNATRELFDR